jgi:GT2 family glycosyltransferase
MRPGAVSVVIVNWNAKAFLTSCLESLTKQETASEVEIIVVDNGSADGSPEAVEERFGQVKLIRLQENVGFAKANNIGIGESSGEYICLSNSDVEATDACIDTMCSYMRSHPRVGMLGPKVLNSDLTIQSSCRTFPSLWNNLCPALGVTTLFPHSRFFAGEHMLYFAYDETREVNTIVGCFVLARRAAIEAVGGLDEQFFFYAEDVDWSKRYWDAGWSLVFYPAAVVVHHHKRSSSNAPLRFAVEQEKAVLRYWKKHYHSLTVCCFRLIALLRHVIRIFVALSAYVLFPKRRAPAFKRMIEHLRCLQSILSSRS